MRVLNGGLWLSELADFRQEPVAVRAELRSVLLEALQDDHVALPEEFLAEAGRVRRAGPVAFSAQILLRGSRDEASDHENCGEGQQQRPPRSRVSFMGQAPRPGYDPLIPRALRLKSIKTKKP